MRLDRNIYTRLYQIAFFMQNIFSEGVKNEFKIQLPNPDTIPIDNPKSRRKIFDICFSALAHKDLYGYEYCRNFMQITNFEGDLFFVCVKVYERLDSLFSSYKEAFEPRRKTKKRVKVNFEDDPEWFFQSIPQDTISKDQIKTNTYGMFVSVKTACYFYCRFTPSYWCYFYSKIIRDYEKEIPVLSHIKEVLSRYFCQYPIDPFAFLKDYFSNLSDLLDTYLIAKNASETLREDPLWNTCFERINDGFLNSFVALAEMLAGESLIPISELKFKDNPNLVVEVEKMRRNKISESQRKRLSEREKQVEEHIGKIFKKVKSKRISIKDACEEYLSENEAALKECGINSAGTLRNLCSNTDPNKQRSAFHNRSYVKPVYSKSLKESIGRIREKIAESKRSESK